VEGRGAGESLCARRAGVGEERSKSSPRSTRASLRTASKAQSVSSTLLWFATRASDCIARTLNVYIISYAVSLQTLPV
jgi:hypothetical protein